MEPWLQGIDVSNWQGGIDWSKVNSNPNIAFVYALVSDGTYRGQPKGASISISAAYNFNKKHCQKPLGPYHYAQMGKTDPYEMADLCLEWCGGDCKLPFMLDIEDGGVAGVPLNDQVGWARAWLERVEDLDGRKPVIYAKNGGIIRFFPNYVWWLPFYPANSKVNPNPEDYRAWTDRQLRGNDGRYYDIWQYTDRGRVDGIPGYVDFNIIKPDVYARILHIPEEEMTTSCIVHANVLAEDVEGNVTAGLRARGLEPFPDLAFQCFDNGTMRQITGDEVRALTLIFKVRDLGFLDDGWFNLLTLIPRHRLT